MTAKFYYLNSGQGEIKVLRDLSESSKKSIKYKVWQYQIGIHFVYMFYNGKYLRFTYFNECLQMTGHVFYI